MAFDLPVSLQAAYWHTLFTTNDHRSELTWENRFKTVALSLKVHNFFSPGDDVVANMPGTVTASVLVNLLAGNGINVNQGAWKAQELTKGLPPTQSIGSIAQSRLQAGWSFNPAWTNVANPATISASALPTEPFFGRFLDSEIMSTNAAAASVRAGTRLAQYDVLARGVPAKSYAVAPNAVPAFDLNNDNDRNYNMEGMKTFSMLADWPSEGHSQSYQYGKWLHSDFKNVSLVFVYKMFDEMIYQGGLK